MCLKFFRRFSNQNFPRKTHPTFVIILYAIHLWGISIINKSIASVCDFGAGINVLCGVGILSMPYAVKVGGWAGLSILLVFAAITWYTGVLLGYCLQSEPGLETYPDIGQAAFGTTGRFIISVSHHLFFMISIIPLKTKKDLNCQCWHTVNWPMNESINCWLER